LVNFVKKKKNLSNLKKLKKSNFQKKKKKSNNNLISDFDKCSILFYFLQYFLLNLCSH
jgi:hypothetical protein